MGQMAAAHSQHEPVNSLIKPAQKHRSEAAASPDGILNEMPCVNMPMTLRFSSQQRTHPPNFPMMAAH